MIDVEPTAQAIDAAAESDNRQRYAVTFVIGTAIANISAKHVMHFKSIAEIRNWSEFHNYVLGAPMLHRATYEIEHVDGTALSVDELQELQPTSSEELYEDRLRKAGLPVSSLNAGVLNVIFTKMRERK